jgi:hypothetical protein
MLIPSRSTDANDNSGFTCRSRRHAGDLPRLDIPGRTYGAIVERRQILGGVQPAKAIMREIRAALPQGLPTLIRDEVRQEIVLGIYECRMRLIDIKSSIPNLLSAYDKRYPQRGAHLSLNAPAFDDGKTTIGDQISSDAFRF